MLAIQVISAVGLVPAKESGSKHDFSCGIRYFGNEIFRTSICNDSIDPVWHETKVKPISEFRVKEAENNRPAFFENLRVEVTQHDRSNNEVLGECRVQLLNIGSPAVYDLYSNDGVFRGKILLGLSVTEDPHGESRLVGHLQLRELLSEAQIQFSHLFLDTNWAPLALVGQGNLTGPSCREVVLDKHDYVEWDAVAGVNSFGDKFTTTCRGSLILTDLRLLFLPAQVSGCAALGLHAIERGVCRSADDLLTLRRFTYQCPLGNIQEIKYQLVDINEALLLVTSKDSSLLEFMVKRRPTFKRLTPQAPPDMLQKLKNRAYRAGIATENILPTAWCNRVVEEVNWLIKDDRLWVHWAKCMRETVKQLNVAESTPLLKKALSGISVEGDYARLKVQESDWCVSDLNWQYKLCDTYPQHVVLPKVLTPDEVHAAAQERSRERLPALVWLHPTNKIPLCRAAQPLAGLSRAPEGDKLMLLMIRSCCPSNLPLRIADARPYINAQANAIQGKGFENISFIGGSSVASLTFLDIPNIHVVRDSLQRLRDGSTSSSNSDAPDALFSSKWLNHISAILRASSGVAESLLLGHPVLVHCSDGWDRTAQMTSLAQIMLDPYYRTIDGFLLLLEKEWAGFGHQFEHRLGKSSSKESSPVFLQFLDCVWQMMQQFPADFEYTSHFIYVISLAAYSGYFLTFRANCESERQSLLKECIKNDIIDPEEVPYTTLSCYIYILLLSNMSDLLISQQYLPPRGQHKLVHYLRPRLSISELQVWHQGILPRSGMIAPRLGAQVAAQSECQALFCGTYSRLMDYLSLHLHELDVSAQRRFEVIASKHRSAVCAVTPHKPEDLFPSAVVASTAHDFTIDETLAAYFFSADAVESAAVKIQLWYRSISSVRRGLQLTTGGLRNVFNNMLISDYKSRAKFQNISRMVTINQMRILMEDIVEDALELALRSQHARDAAERMGNYWEFKASQGASSASSSFFRRNNKEMNIVSESVDFRSPGVADSPKPVQSKGFTGRMFQKVANMGKSKPKKDAGHNIKKENDNEVFL